MHATIQKPLDEILSFLRGGEKVFVVGCGNCATKCNSGGEEEAKKMKERLESKGVEVTGWAVPDATCILHDVTRALNVDNKEATESADSFLVLACGQGVHPVIDATDGGVVHPGCNTIFGGETVTQHFITEYCRLCGECIVEQTGGLCPLTLCAKGLLNGPCGGAKDGKCEVDSNRDCGWVLIYERLKKLGRLDLMRRVQHPKDWSRSRSPRSLTLKGNRADFAFSGKSISAWSGVESPDEETVAAQAP